VLLFDEPTAALDPAAGREILALLSALAEEGKCVLAVMHDLEGGIAIAHRTLLLDGGALTFAGTKEELLTTDRLETAFGVRRYTAEGRIFFA
jgi:iron complex transport system ATP-binding protein